MDKNNLGSTFVGSLLLHTFSAARDACFEKDNSVATQPGPTANQDVMETDIDQHVPSCELPS